ncbi:MAG: redox-regulated ATPase YchF, partial [Clostridiales bacterium]|nr:redox-regulated ATPase YchF [Clostridiales bacterium]
EIPTTFEFIDIAGLVEGASKGEGLGNRFLSHIREVDAIVHVVRCFVDENIIHVDGNVDPLRDMETIELELILADIETVSKREEKAKKMMKSGEAKFVQEADLASRLLQHLEQEQPARTFQANEDEEEILISWFLLTTKPVVYAANISEQDVGKATEEIAGLTDLMAKAQEQQAQVLVISAQIEEEIAQMDEEDKVLFLEELGLEKGGLDRLISSSYELLGLISFLTAGEDECRAWTIKKGTKAPQAAGKIHTDFERGFIRAEVVPYPVLMEQGSLAACREKGLIRSEGKDYVMKDGDVTLFRFNV